MADMDSAFSGILGCNRMMTVGQRSGRTFDPSSTTALDALLQDHTNGWLCISLFLLTSDQNNDRVNIWSWISPSSSLQIETADG